MEDLVKNTTLKPASLANIAYLLDRGMYDALSIISPTMWFVATLFVFTWTIYYNETSLQKEMFVLANRQHHENFEILRDILQENNKDIRSVRKNLTRSAKAKVEAQAVEGLLNLGEE
jgi:valyl-tRNA synthetase